MFELDPNIIKTHILGKFEEHSERVWERLGQKGELKILYLINLDLKWYSDSHWAGWLCVEGPNHLAKDTGLPCWRLGWDSQTSQIKDTLTRVQDGLK